MAAGTGREPRSRWWRASAISTFQLPQCDHNLEKFSNSRVDMNFSVFSIDPTFDLGAFSVTTSTYKQLNLINRRSWVNPVMIGPMLIQQNREKATYNNIFTEYLLNSRPQLQNLQVLGADGEVALSSSFLQRFPQPIPLLCFNHLTSLIT